MTNAPGSRFPVPGSRNPGGSTAVMARRVEAMDSLDDFPTPPWATRALFECVFPAMGIGVFEGARPDALPAARPVWEPAANRGLMAEVIDEYCREVVASDVHDYGYRGGNFRVASFVGEGPDVAAAPAECAAVITNPPFRLATEFYERARAVAPVVALLLRTQFVEGADRWTRIFRLDPPTRIAFFAERVPMVKGRWDPEGSTATAYAWFVWREVRAPLPPFWIPPGQRARLSRPSDIQLAERLGAL